MLHSPSYNNKARDNNKAREQPRVICVAGPSGAGKSAAAAYLAQKLGGAVVNVDSRQVYEDFPIITAQPGIAERRLCPHYLYGFLPCAQKISAGRHAELVGKITAELAASGKTAVLTGGSGLFFRALFGGIADIPVIAADIHEKWQKRLAEEGSPALHELLRRKDPVYAAKIHPNDRQRVTRALEVCEGTGRTFSWWHGRRDGGQGLRPLFLGLALPLKELEPILKARIDLMLKLGAIAEAEEARRKCPSRAAPGWSGIGCAELFSYLAGQTDLESCKRLWLSNTRAYAKRQLTWFRADRSINWFAPGEHEKMLRTAEQGQGM
jgi:tRNA dimethylallyltransferase